MLLLELITVLSNKIKFGLIERVIEQYKNCSFGSILDSRFLMLVITFENREFFILSKYYQLRHEEIVLSNLFPLDLDSTVLERVYPY